jgi:DNA repair exonuclease SbcCD nuclease subunit
MAEECRYTVVYSRYGNHEASTRISALRPMRAFGHSGKFKEKEMDSPPSLKKTDMLSLSCLNHLIYS